MIEIQLPSASRFRLPLFGLLAAGALVHATPPTLAETASFNGQLDYSAFKRSAERRDTVRITYSPGGTGAAALALARNKVIIDGQCNSACAWSFVRNENACFTSRAAFGFHAAHDPGSGRRMDAATTYWLSTVRSSLRSRLTPLLRTSSLINISASQMRTYYGDRLCGAREPKPIDVAVSPIRKGKHALVRETKQAQAEQQQTTANLEALTASLALIEGLARAPQPEVTLSTFARRDIAATLIWHGATPVNTDIARSVAILERPAVPEDGPTAPLSPFDTSKGSGVPISREWLMLAVREEELSGGRIVVGLEGRDGNQDTLRIAEPVEWAMSSAIAAATGDNSPRLPELANLEALPDDCSKPTHMLELHAVSAGPCDVFEGRAVETGIADTSRSG